MNLLQLNDENYYSQEADMQYMSVSQYKAFRKCEAAALAKLKGEWQEEHNDSLLLGSYVHAWLEGALDQFKEKTPSLFTRSGELYSQYKNADLMIETLKDDGLCMFALEGEKEVIITAELFGAHWKSKLDVYNPINGRFVDLKTVKSIYDKVWTDEYGYCSFVEAYGYTIQMAVYAELEKRWSGRENWLEPFIVAVSKEKHPDKAVINFDDEIIQLELDEVEENLPRVLSVKHGMDKPNRCEKCAYCRQTKRLTKVIHYSQILS